MLFELTQSCLIETLSCSEHGGLGGTARPPDDTAAHVDSCHVWCFCRAHTTNTLEHVDRMALDVYISETETGRTRRRGGRANLRGTTSSE